MFFRNRTFGADRVQIRERGPRYACPRGAGTLPPGKIFSFLSRRSPAFIRLMYSNARKETSFSPTEVRPARETSSARKCA